MKVLAYSIHGFDRPTLELAANNKHDLVCTTEQLNSNTVNLSAGFDAVALFTSDNAGAEVLEQLGKRRVKFIALRSVGYEHVDLAAAKSLGIKVANVPEYSPYAIAEHAVALLLALNRKLYASQLLMQMQDFRLDSLVGFDLHGKTVGIIGTGRIGFAFAKIMHGFGCSLLGFDPIEDPSAQNIQLRYCSLDELLEKSDVVSLNCPLNENTKHLISNKQFEKMKDGAILVNTARGGIVNTEALIQNLESGKISGACLDVYEYEKGLFFNDHRTTILKDPLYSRLRSFPNVIITGHQAFLTHEALNGIAKVTIQNIDEWEMKGNCRNEL